MPTSYFQGGGEAQGQSDDSTARSTPVPSPAVSDIEENLRTLTQAVALALANTSVRTSVYQRLRESSYPEAKLKFRSLLEADEVGLLDAAAAAMSTTPSDVLTRLEGIADMELYMPVPDHRARWEGGENALVASALNDDGAPIFGFDLSGHTVGLNSEKPPSTPTIALVPVEIDYWARSASDRDLEASSVSNMLSLNGVVMTGSTIPHDYEGWLMGGPEFEVHTYVDDGMGLWEDISCASEEQISPYYYDQEDQFTWHGEILLGSEGELADENVLFIVWENDSDACDGTGGGQPPISEDDLDDMLAPAITIDIDELSPFEKALGDIIATAIGQNEDDLVGVIQWPPVDCWPEASGGVYADIRDKSLSKVGWAKLDNTFGDRDPICELSTTISGPSTLELCPEAFIPDPEAYYVAGVSGSTGTPSFQWFYDGDLVQESQASDYTVPTEDLSYESHLLEVVTTRGGEQAMDSKGFVVVEGDDCGS